MNEKTNEFGYLENYEENLKIPILTITCHFSDTVIRIRNRRRRKLLV